MRRFPFTAGSGLVPCWLFFRSFFCSFFVLFFCSFFDRFRVPTWGVFGAKNRSTCDLWVVDFYWFYIGFSTIFASWGILCWFDVGSFFASIFGLFGGRFWSPFGSLWGVQIDHFWHQFWDDICISFQERPKSAQERPKSAPQERPRGAQKGPRAAQEGPKSG